MKQKLSIFLAAAVCTGLLIVPAAAVDYPPWAAETMERWAQCGKLDQTASADQELTRGGVAVLIDSVMNYQEQAKNSYRDLNENAPETGALLRLAAAGIVQGDVEGSMRPRARVSRQEAAVMVARAFSFRGQGTADYEDDIGIAPWAHDAVYTLQANGVMGGSGGYFRPMASITYAEMVKVLDNALAVTGPITGITATERDSDGVLAPNAPAQVNDNKFYIAAVNETENGYEVQIRGRHALIGQKADADGLGAPQAAGKWMGVAIGLTGLVRVEELEYSENGETWTRIEENDELAEGLRLNHALFYINGAEDTSESAPEVEKTKTIYVRQPDCGQQIEITFVYIPAQ